jgi:glutamate/tyrosine decarboxylase-like PLP-dependent enzyme
MTCSVQVAPITIHPAFNKAAAYFDLTMVLVPVDANSQVDVAAMAKAITNNTVLLVGSAPQYPHAVVDPIEDIATLAKKFGEFVSRVPDALTVYCATAVANAIADSVVVLHNCCW